LQQPSITESFISNFDNATYTTDHWGRTLLLWVTVHIMKFVNGGTVKITSSNEKRAFGSIISGLKTKLHR